MDFDYNQYFLYHTVTILIQKELISRYPAPQISILEPLALKRLALNPFAPDGTPVYHGFQRRNIGFWAGFGNGSGISYVYGEDTITFATTVS